MLPEFASRAGAKHRDKRTDLSISVSAEARASRSLFQTHRSSTRPIAVRAAAPCSYHAKRGSLGTPAWASGLLHVTPATASLMSFGHRRRRSFASRGERSSSGLLGSRGLG